jgi:hypothetical protein
VVVLIGLPTLFSTPGDKANVIIAAPGWVTIALVLLQFAAAVTSSWLVWPAWAAIPVTVLAAVAVVTERRRWRWLASTTGSPCEALTRQLRCSAGGLRAAVGGRDATG